GFGRRFETSARLNRSFTLRGGTTRTTSGAVGVSFPARSGNGQTYAFRPYVSGELLDRATELPASPSRFVHPSGSFLFPPPALRKRCHDFRDARRRVSTSRVQRPVRGICLKDATDNGAI